MKIDKLNVKKLAITFMLEFWFILLHLKKKTLSVEGLGSKF